MALAQYALRRASALAPRAAYHPHQAAVLRLAQLGSTRQLSSTRPSQLRPSSAKLVSDIPPSSQAAAPLPVGTKATIAIPPVAPAPTAAAAVPPPPPPPPPADPQKPRPSFGKRIGQFTKTLGRGVLVVVLGATGYILYLSEVARHPVPQEDFDPTLPTLVVVGNGWAGTSFIKSLDNEGFNVVVISPRNYFCFTPLLPSVTVGTLASRSLMEPTRFLTRHMKRRVDVYEGEVTDIDPASKTIRFEDKSEITGTATANEIKYDYLVYALGAENQTFGIKGVADNACFLKEIWDAEKIRGRLIDCLETASFVGQPESEVERLLSFVVVGGGPTGVEFAGELHDFLKDDLSNWYPEIASKIKITLIEALPSVLPMFSRELITYTNSTFAENKIDIATKTMVKEVKEKSLVAMNEKKELIEYPYGLLVWATGNTARPLTRKLMEKLPEAQTVRRGLTVDDHMRLVGADGIYALGDCTATNYAPTAQVASQQGRYLARSFAQIGKAHKLKVELERAKAEREPVEKVEELAKAVWKAGQIKPFSYSHQGSLAYIGSEKAIADLPFGKGNFASGGIATYYFWRSAYLSELFSLRNRILVATDWMKTKVLGRDVSRG